MEEPRKKLEDSLNIIGEVFEDIKEACVKGHFKIHTSRLVEAHEVIRCIKLYVILNDIKKLTGRKLEVLAYYLIRGYSKDTKKVILNGLNITDSNLNNINHELRKMGVIKRVGYNQSKNEVSEDLLAFKKFIVDKEGSYILIKIT